MPDPRAVPAPADTRASGPLTPAVGHTSSWLEVIGCLIVTLMLLAFMAWMIFDLMSKAVEGWGS